MRETTTTTTTTTATTTTTTTTTATTRMNGILTTLILVLVHAPSPDYNFSWLDWKHDVWIIDKYRELYNEIEVKLEKVDEPRQNRDASRLPDLLLNCTVGTLEFGKWKDRPHQTKFVTGYHTSTVTIEKKSSKSKKWKVDMQSGWALCPRINSPRYAQKMKSNNFMLTLTPSNSSYHVRVGAILQRHL